MVSCYDWEERFLHGDTATALYRFIPGIIYPTETAHNRAPRLLFWYKRTIKVGTGAVETSSLMNNHERIQARIARDKARKAVKRQAAKEKYGNFKNVMTMQNLVKSLQRRRKNTEWKGSVQRFISHAIVKLKRIHDSAISGKLDVSQRIRHLVVVERGKRRDCHAIMIDSRVAQGVICDSSITPLTQPPLIYDNPASTAGKGVSGARRRMQRHIEKQIRESGSDFYVFSYDLKGYFDNIPHSRCRHELRKAGQDAALERMTMDFVKMYKAQDISLITDPAERKRRYDILAADKDVGATLGSQISQNMALVIPNDVDHAVKDRLRCHKYIRYMDDGNAMHKSKEYLRNLWKTIEVEYKKIGLKLHPKKTHIVKASKGFMFLKVFYIVTESGKIVKKIAKSSIIRMRRKLKKFYRLVAIGKMTKDDVFNSFMSWWGTAKRVAQTYRQRHSMLNLYNKLFSQYRTGGLVA